MDYVRIVVRAKQTTVTAMARVMTRVVMEMMSTVTVLVTL